MCPFFNQDFSLNSLHVPSDASFTESISGKQLSYSIFRGDRRCVPKASRFILNAVRSDLEVTKSKLCSGTRKIGLDFFDDTPCVSHT